MLHYSTLDCMRRFYTLGKKLFALLITGNRTQQRVIWKLRKYICPLCLCGQEQETLQRHRPVSSSAVHAGRSGGDIPFPPSGAIAASMRGPLCPISKVLRVNFLFVSEKLAGIAA
jgi:hypothetical protein